jgi:hypothetical protein
VTGVILAHSHSELTQVENQQVTRSPITIRQTTTTWLHHNSQTPMYSTDPCIRIPENELVLEFWRRVRRLRGEESQIAVELEGLGVRAEVGPWLDRSGRW